MPVLTVPAFLALAILGAILLFDDNLDRSGKDSARAKKSKRRGKNMQMSTPRAFISFDFDHDETHRMLLVGQAKNSRTPFSLSDWSLKSALPQSQWERDTSERIARCNLMIVLVGQDTWYATGVIKEIGMATSNRVPFFGIYVRDANSETRLPSGLQRNRVIYWEWDSIDDAISQMMSEGKNVE